MELDPSQEEGDMPIPLNSSYGRMHDHMTIHHHHHHPSHNHIIPSSTPQPIQSNAPALASSTLLDHNGHHLPNINHNFKKIVKYRECLKNHAAFMGGNAIDGCGEFMPSREEGSLEALTCSACTCHRNFHRKEIEGDPFYPHNSRIGRKFFLGHNNNHKGYFGQNAIGYHKTGAALISSRPIMSYNMGSFPSESEEPEDAGAAVCGRGVVARPLQMGKKRFRTKFSQEQKEKMMGFAEKIGWKIQKEEESVVEHFCEEIGVKRRVLKVWMHNNKHNLAKKNSVHHMVSVNHPPQTQV